MTIPYIAKRQMKSVNDATLVSRDSRHKPVNLLEDDHGAIHCSNMKSIT